MKIAGKSALVGEKLADSPIPRKAGVIILALKSADGKMTFNPLIETIVRANDCLIVIGADEQLRHLEVLAF